MGALIKEAIRRIDKKLEEIYSFPKTPFASGYERACRSTKKMILELEHLEPEIIYCKDCKFYTPMNMETKSGVCSLLMHQNFGDDWYCAGAERKTNMADTFR